MKILQITLFLMASLTIASAAQADSKRNCHGKHGDDACPKGEVCVGYVPGHCASPSPGPFDPSNSSGLSCDPFIGDGKQPCPFGRECKGGEMGTCMTTEALVNAVTNLLEPSGS
jgi:hypothetical protein